MTRCPEGGGGVLAVYMTGRPDVSFWVENLHPRYVFGSRDLSRIVLGIKVWLIEEISIEVFKSCFFFG